MITDEIVCDDDLTISYQEIVKANNKLLDETLDETKKIKIYKTLKFRIKTLMDNSKGKARHTNNRALKAYKERLTGKNGLIRSNLNGKRSNQTGRTVIGPDPNIGLDYVGIPKEMCEILTVPEIVCDYNIDVEYCFCVVIIEWWSCMYDYLSV